MKRHWNTPQSWEEVWILCGLRTFHITHSHFINRVVKVVVLVIVQKLGPIFLCSQCGIILIRRKYCKSEASKSELLSKVPLVIEIGLSPLHSNVLITWHPSSVWSWSFPPLYATRAARSSAQHWPEVQKTVKYICTLLQEDGVAVCLQLKCLEQWGLVLFVYMQSSRYLV